MSNVSRKLQVDDANRTFTYYVAYTIRYPGLSESPIKTTVLKIPKEIKTRADLRELALKIKNERIPKEDQQSTVVIVSPFLLQE
jgi:hypothetical protein